LSKPSGIEEWFLVLREASAEEEITSIEEEEMKSRADERRS
jgi:hypothetical protein